MKALTSSSLITLTPCGETKRFTTEFITVPDIIALKNYELFLIPFKKKSYNIKIEIQAYLFLLLSPCVAEFYLHKW